MTAAPHTDDTPEAGPTGRRLLLATRSPHKAREIQEILDPLDLYVETLAHLGIEPTPEEDGIEAFDTFEANAIAKARYFARRLDRITVADDSGLRVDALDGDPGVHTKRFSGRDDLEGQALDRANNQLLLKRLEGVPNEARGARYVCCAAVAWPDGRALTATGTVRGTIASELRGDGGFGYDPLFHVPELDARFAEVPAGAKNRISHRSRAFRALTAALQSSPWPLR
ncbi:MAG: RdgB/HAM1 family non-canonical purine NTP pyrophosphatase [Longimicrobiales bacterium]|nr:RdgB/HAM1 family non-canonical purine NTP pyrophosphatase [Longimicrobiales bacterium]